MTTLVHSVPLPARRAGWVTPAAIGLLLALRILVLGLGAWLFRPTPAWLDPLYQTGTYLLTLFLIFWERERLEEYHIGWLAVGLLLVFKPLETLLLTGMGAEQGFPMAFPNLPALIVWAAALALCVGLLLTRPTLRRVTAQEGRWFGWGVLIGLVTIALLAVPMALQLKWMNATVPDDAPTFLGGFLIPILLFDFPYQLGYAAASEEPLFRGFLWGWLRQRRWQGHWIWLFQAGLFMLSHIYYITRLPYSFWIIVPVGALVMGWVAWRSRSIAASMAAHATLNSLGMRLGQLVYLWFFR